MTASSIDGDLWVSICRTFSDAFKVLGAGGVALVHILWWVFWVASWTDCVMTAIADPVAQIMPGGRVQIPLCSTVMRATGI